MRSRLLVVIVAIVILITGCRDPKRARETIDAMRRIGTAIEWYAVDHGFYATASSIHEMKNFTKEHDRGTWTRDAWGNEFMLESNHSTYILISAGSDGKFETKYWLEQGEQGEEYSIGRIGSTPDMRNDIVYKNVRFLQWPEGAAKRD